MAGTHTRVHDRSLGWPVLSRLTGELARVSSEQMAIRRVEEAGEGMEESPEAKFRLWGEGWGGRQGQGRTDRPPGTLSPGPVSPAAETGQKPAVCGLPIFRRL